MKHFQLSASTWKLLITALAMMAMSFVLAELRYSVGPLSQRTWGALPVKGNYINGTGSKGVRILELSQDSPFIALGASVGDTVVFDPADEFHPHRWRAGEAVGLTVVHEGSSHHAVINTIATPIPSGAVFGLCSDMLVSAVAAVFAVLIAFKQPVSKTYRLLTLFFLVQAFNCDLAFVPPGVVKLAADVGCWGLGHLIVYFSAMFSIYYPTNNPQHIRAAFARCAPAFTVITMVATFYILWHLMTGNGEDIVFWCWGTGAILTLVALWDGWRYSTGAERQRYGWLLASIGTATLLSFLWNVVGFLPYFNTYPTLRLIGFPLYQSSLLLMEIGIVYAVLKHRVFNFSFAMNRAILYSATSLVLLVAFGVVEWLSEHFLHFEGREANVLIDGAAALAVYLAFHKIRHVFEHWLERVFFHKWHANEAKLRQFVKKAVHITTTEALMRDFHTELKRFSGGAACSIYRQNAQGNYDLLTNADTSNADCIDINDDISVSLRTEQTPIMVEDTHPHHAGKLALPMTHRGELHGYVLLRTKSSGEEYRPDEMELLGFAAHQIGLDLFALRIERLEAKADTDEAKIRNLQLNNETLQTIVAQIGDRLNQLRA